MFAAVLRKLFGLSMRIVTGYPDGPPCNPQGPADPVVGVHAGQDPVQHHHVVAMDPEMGEEARDER